MKSLFRPISETDRLSCVFKLHRKLEDNEIYKFSLYNFYVRYKSAEELNVIVQGMYVEVMCLSLKNI